MSFRFFYFNQSSSIFFFFLNKKIRFCIISRITVRKKVVTQKSNRHSPWQAVGATVINTLSLLAPCRVALPCVCTASYKDPQSTILVVSPSMKIYDFKPDFKRLTEIMAFCLPILMFNMPEINVKLQQNHA